MKKWMVIVLAELVLLFLGIAGLFCQSGVVYVAETEGLSTDEREDEVVYLTEKIPLQAGVYEAVLTYQTTEDGVHDFGVLAEDELAFRGLRSNEVTLFSDKNKVKCEFYLLDSCQAFQAYVQQEEGGLVAVEKIEIDSTNAGSRILIFWTVLFSLLVNGAIWLYDKNAKGLFSKEKQIALAGCVIMILLACLPLFVDYIISADAVVGNLATIERVSNDFLSAGAEGNWVLVIPAFLREIGLSMNMSYRLCLWLINVVTVGVAYISFYRCTGKELAALAGTALWTLNPYRISVLYEKADLLAGTWLLVVPAGIALVWCLVRCMFGKECDGAAGTKNVKKGKNRHAGGGLSRGQVCAILLIVVSLFSATYQTNQILVNGHPLWVYSMEDMMRVDEAGLIYLVEDTYGMK